MIVSFLYLLVFASVPILVSAWKRWYCVEPDFQTQARARGTCCGRNSPGKSQIPVSPVGKRSVYRMMLPSSLGSSTDSCAEGVEWNLWPFLHIYRSSEPILLSSSKKWRRVSSYCWDTSGGFKQALRVFP